MIKYIVNRILTMIPVILGISFLIFSIMNLTPGDPAEMALGSLAKDDDLEVWREKYGLNEGFFIRYGKYILNAVQGDLGRSYRTDRLVADEVAERIPTSLTLAAGATCVMIMIGVPIGIISAVRQYSIVDTVSLFSALLLTSMPAFWLGLMLILLFSLKLDLLPATGTETLANFILPWVTLAAAVGAALLRMTRSNMLEVIRQDYIRTAKAKGAGPKKIIFKHALRNALLPIVTIVGLNFGSMLGGSIITESVFALPGIGSLLVTSVRMKDTPIVMGCVLFIAIMIGVINLVVDILYVYIDPRLKTQFIRG